MQAPFCTPPPPHPHPRVLTGKLAMSLAGCDVTFCNWHNLAVICITARKVMVIALPHLGEFGILTSIVMGPKLSLGLFGYYLWE